MSTLSQFAGGGKSLKFQEFLASGTFTPSDKLLAAGGVVQVKICGGGGGGGGATSATSTYGYGGGGGTSYLEAIGTISGPVSVVIGAGGGGGTGTNPGVIGGTSTFDAISVSGGGGGNYGISNNVGSPGAPGGIGRWGISTRGGECTGGDGVGRGGAGATSYNTSLQSSATSGGRGYCLVSWWE